MPKGVIMHKSRVSGCGSGRGGTSTSSIARQRTAAPRASSTRRDLLLTSLVTSAGILAGPKRGEAKATYDKRALDELTKLFGEAIELSNKGDAGEQADDAWSRIIEFDKTSSAAWSNRGTFRLQRGRWAESEADLAKAIELEGGINDADGYLTNNYGNALGANGKWDEALSAYRQASFAGSQAGDNDLSEISDANHALGLLQVGRDADALEEIRGLLRRDPNFLDMRAAETAALWAQGEAEAAEAAWNVLQNADTDTGLYSKQFAIARVQGRWPPRATAALSGFITVQSKGNALDYDGKLRTYDFGSK